MILFAQRATDGVRVSNGRLLPWTAENGPEWGWVAAENLLLAAGYCLVAPPTCGELELEVKYAEQNDATTCRE
jgi:hypothetical protein